MYNISEAEWNEYLDMIADSHDEPETEIAAMSEDDDEWARTCTPQGEGFC